MKNMFDEGILGQKKATSPSRDRRRIFSKVQKDVILRRQHGECARCGKKLIPGAIRFNHKKPWAEGGKTEIRNGEALCANCDALTTHKQQLRKGDRSRSNARKSPLDVNLSFLNH